MKKVLKSIFCKKRIPVIIIFTILTVLFLLLCIMFFPAEKDSGNKVAEVPDNPAIAETTVPEPQPEPEVDTKDNIQELYVPYSLSFDDKRIAEPNALCLLDGETAIGLQQTQGETASFHSHVHGFPVVFIGSSFELQKDITGICLPDSVVGILSQPSNELDAKGAFYNNQSLETFIPSENFRYIGNKAFYNCKNLKNLFLPMSLSHIGSRAFYGCTSLESAEIYGSVAIGDNAFTGCTSLESVYLSQNVKRVGLGAFENTPFYDSLTDEFCIVGDVLVKYNGTSENIVIPDGVRIIADGVFAGKLSAKSVVIPGSVEYIGNSAFRSCARLESAEFDESTPPTVGINAFEGCTEAVTASVASLDVDERDMYFTEINSDLLKAE